MPGQHGGTADEPPPRLRVRMLGAVEVILDGKRLRAFNSLRLQRFLAMIALHRKPQHRSRVAFALWPDSDDRQARTNLRKLLHEFRHALPDVGEFVDIDNETVGWKAAGSSEVDALRFRDAVGVGDRELAARLYRGDLLPACYDDWVLDERTRLRAEAHGVLVRLTEEAAQRGDHETAISHAGRIVELEPTDEAAARIQMQAHLALGDNAAALRSYHRHAEALQRELALEPSKSLRALYDELRTGARDGPDRPSGGVAPVAESPFVGREREWRLLHDAWNAARKGGAHLVLITGEAGIGKSRLALELGRRVRTEGHGVASARSYEAAGRVPWGPVVDLLRSDALRGQVDTLDPGFRAELARLMPELADASAAVEPGSSDAAERYRLFDAASRALAGSTRPRLLIIDDLQWCDTETIELIGFMIRSGKSAPILIVGTARWEEVPEDHPAVGLVEALGNEHAITTVPLERFDEATTAALATRLSTEAAIGPQLAARLWSETEGNPLFVIEAVRAGIDADRARSVLTPTMRAVLRARLDQLSVDARQLAAICAVIGRAFPVDLLVSATGSEESDLVDHLDELWRRRIIRDHGATYDFSHDKLRAVALEMVSPARRRQLHRAVAAAIAGGSGDDPGAVSPRLAAHYDQAGMVRQAIDAYRVAGTRAASVSALEEAIALFRRALSLLADLPGSADRDALELELRIALGSPLVAIEGYGAKNSHQLYERARSLCRKLQRTVDPPILRGLGLARLQGCRFDDCSELAQALLDQESSDPIAGTEGRYLLGVSAFWRGDLTGAQRHLDGAIDSYDPTQRDEHLASYAQDPKAVCLVRRALVELWSGDPRRADGTARAALQVADDLDHRMTSAYVVTYAAILAAEADDSTRLAELLVQAERLWKRLSERYLVVVLDALRGWLEVHEGSVAGIDRIVRSVERSRNDGETLHLTYTLLLLARARGLSGELHAGRTATSEGLAWTDRYGQRYLEAELWRVDGELAYRGGEREAAAASLHRAAEISAAQGALWPELRSLSSLVSRFPDPTAIERLKEVSASIRSGRDLPAFRAAAKLLGDFG